jgi:hypothetical protein
MKKITLISFLILIFFLSGCNPVTTTDVTTNFPTTTPETTDFTTIINDEIYIRLQGGIDTVEIESEWIDNGASLIINGAAHPMVTFDFVDVRYLGIYKIHYAYTYQEVVYEIDRYVIVVDQTAPVITLNLGVDTVKLGTEWIDAGAEVSDNSGEDLDLIKTGTVDVNTLGTYVITYEAVDSSGNETIIYRYVTVVE